MLPDLRHQYGIVVAARAGQALYSGDSLQLGDVIYSVGTEPVTSIEALRSAVDGLKETSGAAGGAQRPASLRDSDDGIEEAP